MIIVVEGLNTTYEQCFINKMSIESSLNKTHTIVSEVDFPIVLDFEPHETKQNFAMQWCGYHPSHLLDLDYKMKEEITVILDLSVTKENSEIQRKVLSLKCIPYSERRAGPLA